MSMFSFQAIHNRKGLQHDVRYVVYRLCQCSLFKQFTTVSCAMFLVNCCLSIMSMFSFQAIHNCSWLLCCYFCVVYRLCQCSLFKQFTTNTINDTVNIVVYRLCQCSLFKQFTTCLFCFGFQCGCLSIMPMFFFGVFGGFGVF